MQILQPLYQKYKQRKKISWKLLPAWFLNAFKALLTLAVLVMAYQYFQIKIYEFPETQSFRGDSLYNPYEEGGQVWLKGNFHTHAIAWNGLTNGHQESEEVIRQYQKFGYDISSISDYNAMNPNIYTSGNIAVPVYEHGANIAKNHQLVLGSDGVQYFDVMLWQNDNIKQYIIDRLKNSAEAICLAHPKRRNAYPVQEFSYLTGYDCIEIMSRGLPALAEWDEALSAGRPVWLLANDDSHDVYQDSFAKCWTMVQAPEKKSAAVLKSIKTGKTYGVERKKYFPQKTLLAWLKENEKPVIKKITTEGNTVHFQFSRSVPEIRLIGQGGTLKLKANNTDEVSYDFSPKDTYIRAELALEEMNIYLNPILRYDGLQAPANTMQAKIQILPTLIIRVSIVTFTILLLTFLYRKLVLWILYGKVPAREMQYEFS